MPCSAGIRVRHASRLVLLVAAVGLASLAAAAAPGATLEAQRVERQGPGDPGLDRRLDRLLRSGAYLLITRDTLIGAADSVPRSVLVVDARLILEGAVAGDLVEADADVFLRPGARIHGDIVNLGGGLYRSGLAEVTGEVVGGPLAPYRARREDGVVVIEGTAERTALELDGILGFHAPTYDRVNALGLDWGATYRLPPLGRSRPSIHGWIGYRSERGALNGGGEFAFERGADALLLGAEEVTATNERWIRGDARNSLTFLATGKDHRNYYEAERWYAGVRHRFGRGRNTLTAELRGRTERAESLRSGDPWVAFGDPFRFNPPIDEGRINEVLVTAAGEWVGESAAVEGEAGIEVAGELLGGDFSFGRFVTTGEWAMDALANHLLEVEWYFQGPLPGTGSLPRQRWSFVGGGGTLPTFEIGEFRGDRVVFVETEYIIPLPERLRLPIIGVPDLELVHAFGMAWTEDADRDLEQNIGVRLEFFGPAIRLMTNPDDPIDDLELDLVLSWPFDDDRPWRRP
ncbi:MAG TPA: hypothetical protein VF188_13970 [Longimicrobiales bacterium]